jgi:hypothetical protein
MSIDSLWSSATCALKGRSSQNNRDTPIVAWAHGPHHKRSDLGASNAAQQRWQQELLDNRTQIRHRLVTYERR